VFTVIVALCDIHRVSKKTVPVLFCE